jgi:hypothetical protein
MMDWYSQAGQDQFVHAIHGGVPGTFLDIGCHEPVYISNTYALEQLGWRGLLVDIVPEFGPRIAEKRTSPFLCADATTIDWVIAVRDYSLPKTVDYLSFDLDEAGASALARMPWTTLRFRILTVEHDAYRFGDGPRQAMRALLRGHGYDLLCPDVCNGGPEYGLTVDFEDWWVDPTQVDMNIANKFRTTGATRWADIVGRSQEKE